MALVRPRLNDFYDLPFSQEQVSFAIPLLDEDLPLYVDPFLLWKSPSQQDNSLHAQIIISFNHLGTLFLKGRQDEAVSLLIKLSECDEVGLGNSMSRIGLKIGPQTAIDILSLFQDIPQVQKSGFTHFEEVQLLIEGVAQDRISDIACSLLMSFLVDYTIDECKRWSIPTAKSQVNIYNCKSNQFVSEAVDLPVNPDTKQPVVLVPKRWLRFVAWINFSDFQEHYFAKHADAERFRDRVAILDYNRHNYGIVQAYVATREGARNDCSNDPLFRPIPAVSMKRKTQALSALKTGKTDNADKEYEGLMAPMLASAMYPELDFAAAQSRTVSNVLIRDLIFYNNRACDITIDLHKLYESRQIVMEMKNVAVLNNDHIDQLNRYMKEEFGRFGVILTRNPAPKAVYKNTIDLWSGQRRCILVLIDEDIKLMGKLYESKQRLPIEVLKKKYVEF
ncbi:MAG TPA: hypothetical protein VJ044_00515, partial [Candidatus Hodarchaeales archaeon]|nr:hypothetical protein [Candidatus Hodarchaeales archaeon]